jgi:hypothetical protein
MENAMGLKCISKNNIRNPNCNGKGISYLDLE